MKERRLPKPPARTAFRLGKDGEYHHTVTRADLHLSAKGVTTGKLSGVKLNIQKISEKPREKPENAG